jgi:hypothetical protein
MGNNICCSSLNGKSNSLKIKVKGFCNSCFFYRKCNEEFGLTELVPEGVCPDLFSQIYPQYLSLLYDGKPPAKDIDTSLICPGNKAKTYWRIKSRKLWLSFFINLADKIFRILGQPKDLFDRKIEIEMIGSDGECPCGYKGNIKFSFNQYSHIWGRRFFCPAVFYTLYPFLISIKPQEKISLQCPADYTSIIFEITQSREEN